MTIKPLPPNQQLVRGDRWPLVGERHPRTSDVDAPWSIEIVGCVTEPRIISLDQLAMMKQVTKQIDVHCVTRWSKPAMEFTGIPLLELLYDASTPIWTSDANYVSFVARSDRGHSTSLPLKELLTLDAMVALQANGQPLTTEHGGPVRMVVPGKYFYKSVKWIERIELLPQERLGYWESEAGYHNGADPWQEERYIASTLTKQEALRVIGARDFTSRDLRSINAAHRDLNDLNAKEALLRNADFRGASLHRANFSDANLSNAMFQFADLRDACLANADIEGANFSGADLRGCDLRVASMFGASFCDLVLGDTAIMDSTTLVDETMLDALVDQQKAFVLDSIRPQR